MREVPNGTAEADCLICFMDTDVSQAMHRAPVRVSVPSLTYWGTCDLLYSTSNRTDLPLRCFESASTWGEINANLPFFLLSHQLVTSGMSIPHAGFGQAMVRAQIQAITLPSDPSGSFSPG